MKQPVVGVGELTLDLTIGVQVDGAYRELAALTSDVEAQVHLDFYVLGSAGSCGVFCCWGWR